MQSKAFPIEQPGNVRDRTFTQSEKDIFCWPVKMCPGSLRKAPGRTTRS